MAPVRWTAAHEENHENAAAENHQWKYDGTDGEGAGPNREKQREESGGHTRGKGEQKNRFIGWKSIHRFECQPEYGAQDENLTKQHGNQQWNPGWHKQAGKNHRTPDGGG